MAQEMGLRERKRLAAMRRIQEVALDLFDRHGYQQVSIEQIAAAAEVSPSSVYRYFGTKERIVIWDEYDPIAVERMAEELTHRPPIAALRAAVADTLAELLRADEQRARRRVAYMMQEPAIAAATAVQAHDVATMIMQRLAGRLGRPSPDLDLHLLAHGFVGAVIGAMRYWYATDFQAGLDELTGRVVELFEHGFPLT